MRKNGLILSFAHIAAIPIKTKEKEVYLFAEIYFFLICLLVLFAAIHNPPIFYYINTSNDIDKTVAAIYNESRFSE